MSTVEFGKHTDSIVDESGRGRRSIQFTTFTFVGKKSSSSSSSSSLNPKWIEVKPFPRISLQLLPSPLEDDDDHDCFAFNHEEEEEEKHEERITKNDELTITGKEKSMDSIEDNTLRNNPLWVGPPPSPPLLEEGKCWEEQEKQDGMMKKDTTGSRRNAKLLRLKDDVMIQSKSFYGIQPLARIPLWLLPPPLENDEYNDNEKR